MGMFWHYYSFPRERWNHLFGGGAPGAAREVMRSYMWDRLDGSEPDIEDDPEEWLAAVIAQTPSKIVDLATDICRNGFSYENRTEDEAEILDEMACGFFCPEGIEDLLQAKHLSNNGIKPYILEELIARGRATRHGGFLGIGGTVEPRIPTERSRFIVGGRRVGSDKPPVELSQYVIFWDDEVPEVLREIEQLLKRDRPWRHAEFATEVHREILAALAAAESSNRCLFGHYG